MWYLFDAAGVCFGTASGPIEPMEGVISIFWIERHDDIDHVFLVNGEPEYIP